MSTWTNRIESSVTGELFIRVPDEFNKTTGFREIPLGPVHIPFSFEIVSADGK